MRRWKGMAGLRTRCVYHSIKVCDCYLAAQAGTGLKRTSSRAWQEGSSSRLLGQNLRKATEEEGKSGCFGLTVEDGETT